MAKVKLNKEQRGIVARQKAAIRNRVSKARIQETVAQKVGLTAGAAALGWLNDGYDVAPGDTTVSVSPTLPMAAVGYGAALLLPAGNVAAALEGMGDAALAIGTHNMVRKRQKVEATTPTTPTASTEGLDARETRAFEAGVDAAVGMLAQQENARA